MEINFSHGFHNTNITVYAKGGELTPRQIKKVEKKLCGMADCSCPMYPIYGITANEATAVLTKDGELSVYYEVWVEYDIENLPFITSADFCADVDGWAETVQGSYSPRGKYLAMIKCPVENYEWLVNALRDSELGLTVVK